MDENIKITLRVSSEAKKKVEEESKKLGLSQNGYINLAILNMDIKKIIGSNKSNSVK